MNTMRRRARTSSGSRPLGPQSYVEQHRVFVRPDFKGDWQNCKVGVDASSVDQEMLTRFCFADKPVQYVPIIYSQLVPFLHSGVIDAGVWSADMLPEGLSYYPMPRWMSRKKIPWPCLPAGKVITSPHSWCARSLSGGACGPHPAAGDAQADHSALLSKGAVKQKSHLHGGHADVSFGMKIQNIV